MRTKSLAIVGATVLAALSPVSLSAQATDVGTVQPADDDDGFPWGLLGLLGLAGLLGMKRDDRDRTGTRTGV